MTGFYKGKKYECRSEKDRKGTSGENPKERKYACVMSFCCIKLP